MQKNIKARKCEMRKKSSIQNKPKNQMVWVDKGGIYMYVIGKMQFYQKFGLFRSLIALNMHIYVEHAIYGWVVDIKMQKYKMRAGIDDGDFFFVCLCIRAPTACCICTF